MPSIKLVREPAPTYTTEQPIASTSQESTKEDNISAWIYSKVREAYVFFIDSEGIIHIYIYIYIQKKK